MYTHIHTHTQNLNKVLFSPVESQDHEVNAHTYGDADIHTSENGAQNDNVANNDNADVDHVTQEDTGKYDGRSHSHGHGHGHGHMQNQINGHDSGTSHKIREDDRNSLIASQNFVNSTDLDSHSHNLVANICSNGHGERGAKGRRAHSDSESGNGCRGHCDSESDQCGCPRSNTEVSSGDENG
jgi:hypothetical protein